MGMEKGTDRVVLGQCGHVRLGRQSVRTFDLDRLGVKLVEDLIGAAVASSYLQGNL